MATNGRGFGAIEASFGRRESILPPLVVSVRLCRCSRLNLKEVRVSPIPPAERRLLAELGVLSDRIRALRKEPHPNALQIRPLEAHSSLKWQELRLLRAGPINADVFPAERRSHYR